MRIIQSRDWKKIFRSIEERPNPLYCPRLPDKCSVRSRRVWSWHYLNHLNNCPWHLICRGQFITTLRRKYFPQTCHVIFSSHRVDIHFVHGTWNKVRPRSMGTWQQYPALHGGTFSCRVLIMLRGLFLCLLRNTHLVFTVQFTTALRASLGTPPQSSKVGQSCQCKAPYQSQYKEAPAKTLVKALSLVTIYWVPHSETNTFFHQKYLKHGRKTWCCLKRLRIFCSSETEWMRVCRFIIRGSSDLQGTPCWTGFYIHLELRMGPAQC